MPGRSFEFTTATRILFGNGLASTAATEANALGSRLFLVTGSNPNRVGHVIDSFRSMGLSLTHFEVAGEPTLNMVEQAVQEGRTQDCDVVVAIGGGSVIDSGKAIAALLTNEGELLDYLEGIGRGQKLEHPSAPFMAMPTTAGTGSEVTKNAVLCSPEKGVKVSMRSALMLPTLAIVDPELTYSLPPEVTAATGLDALTQLLEAFTSSRCQPITDALCREGLLRAGRSLAKAVQKGTDTGAREDMALASLFSGIALANAGLGAVHGFAGPIGGQFHAPHGAVCARLLPFVLTANRKGLMERAPGTPVLDRFQEMAVLLTGQAEATPADGEAWVNALCEELKVPGLQAYGLDEDSIPGLVAKAQRASSMKGNPIELNEEELTSILRKAL